MHGEGAAGTTVLVAWAGQVSRTPGPAVCASVVALLPGPAVGAPLSSAVLGAGVLPAFGLAAAVTLVGVLPPAPVGR